MLALFLRRSLHFNNRAELNTDAICVSIHAKRNVCLSLDVAEEIEKKIYEFCILDK